MLSCCIFRIYFNVVVAQIATPRHTIVLSLAYCHLNIYSAMFCCGFLVIKIETILSTKFSGQWDSICFKYINMTLNEAGVLFGSYSYICLKHNHWNVVVEIVAWNNLTPNCINLVGTK